MRGPQKPHMPPSAYPLATPLKSYEHDADGENGNDTKRWSDTQASKTPTGPRPAESFDRSSNSVSRRSIDSISTISAGRRLEQGQYKVVINHAAKHPGEQILPTLEVPIPHYRLGTPRFSTRGTAFLHSQVYSRTSTADDNESSAVSGPELDAMFPVPPGMEAHTTLSRRHSHAAPQPHTVQITPSSSTGRIPITTKPPLYQRARQPIVPAIYDAISANPDDPAIVRYALNSREISAASPARLIAQITSKNFLDYELLSDFFLTVRAYMSTHDLLAYLLTRFEWAVNRFDDDGRVIRVRAFAAIRHWVLNYFPYDFVVDRDLRVKFCQHLNNLTRQVRQRSSHEPSDLKLIVDLKKCWNGRCALYWDCPTAEADGRFDLDISPGGIVGSRDSHLTHPSELWAKIAESSSQQIDQAKSVAALHNWVDSVIEAEVEGKARSERGVSVSTSRSFAMASPLSDLSVPAMSCSIPGKTMKAFASTQAHRNMGPHPVPTTVPPTARRIAPAAPSAQANEKTSRSKHEHKRSGSFQDALADRRTSLPAMQAEQSTEQVVMTFPFSGSLIRGSVLPPGSPFIDNLAPHGSATSLQKQYMDNLGGTGTRVTVRPMSPGVKNLLGTIRRAIGSKQSPNVPPPTLLSTAPFMVETKDSALPMHIAFKIEGFGDQHHQLEALKKNSRIDLLCADITEMFERAVTQEPYQRMAPMSIGVASGNEREQPSPHPPQPTTSSEHEALQRSHSEMTYGSQSIVIMDDTAEEPPVPPLPSEFHRPAEEYSFESSHPPYSTADLSTPALPAKAFQPPVSPQPSGQTPSEGDTPHSALLPPFTVPVMPGIQGVLPTSPPANQSSNYSVMPVSSPEWGANKTAGVGRAAPSHGPRPSIATGKSFASYRSSRSAGGRSLRKYASYQSGMRTSGPEYGGTASASDSPAVSLKGQFDQPGGRMLRRRPGGDLRANENVHDMELRRPRSTGSITTHTDSMHNSMYLKRITARKTAHQEFSQVADGPAPAASDRAVSLVSTRQSKPDLRPSFEAAVAEFARIPDDEGGDLEATLAKLEGKFRKSPVNSSQGCPPTEDTTVVGNGSLDYPPQSRSPKPQTSEQGFGSQNQSVTKGDQKGGLGTAKSRSLYAESEDSYNATPLLERGLRKNSKQNANATSGASGQSNATIPQPLFTSSNPNPHQATHDQSRESSLPTEDEVEDSEAGSYEANLRRGRYRSSMPTCTTDSFLLDEDEFLSDLSSEMSEDPEGPNDALDEAYESSARLFHGSMFPTTAGFPPGYLPSPPMTTENAMAINSETNRMQEQRKPPTPEPSPVSRSTESGKSRTPGQVDLSVLQPFANTVHQFPTRRHIPFTLAFDAAILAQQFTIIEKDALNEINWQDLIDMRWSSSKTETLNWVEYLRYGDPTGIELVTARFNIIVKWALSEIVLTHSMEERALTIIKYINVAHHARKYHNYATMLQLTIALTSVDCTRLTKTWELVPAADKALLKEMETLISPLRNFHNLRQEMETANLEDGCIPVVGKYPQTLAFPETLLIENAALYIHDLTYNAQKPSVIASTRDGEPLINFERYRTTATIVKSLLRLIDASAKYSFKPVEGAIERCLWMASLSDDMIRVKSREVEAEPPR